MPAEWRRFGRFLARPALPARDAARAPLTILARLYALDIAIMLALLTLAFVAVAAGIELPETALAEMEFTPGLIVLVIIGAPLLEEIAFRGWLSGRPGHLLAAAIIAAGLLITFGTDLTQSDAGVNVAAIGLPLAVFVGALAALIVLRGRPAPGWYERLFPLFFWGSAIGFALIHIANFGDAPLVMVLPLVIPQFVLGTILAYLRVNIGLWAAILLHAAHNATALGIASLAMGAEAGAS